MVQTALGATGDRYAAAGRRQNKGMYGEGREKARRGPSPRRSTICNPHGPHFHSQHERGLAVKGRLRKERLGWVVQGGGRKERTQRGKRVERMEGISLGRPASKAMTIREEMGGQEAATMEGVAKFGGQRISGRSKCECGFVVPGLTGSWLAGLAGWLANPQGSCGGKSLAGSVSVAGVVRCCWRFQGMARMAMPPLASPAFPVDIQLQRPCRVPH